MEKDIVEVCQKLHEKNLIAGVDGNVSVLCGAGKILITPSGASKSSLGAGDICSMDLSGKPLKGSPSSEKNIHLIVYREQKKARAVVHAHPPFTVALSLIRPEWKTLPPVLPETVAILGAAPFIPYSCPGTVETAEGLIPFLKENRALILSRHGAVTWGEDLKSAYQAMECLEHSARIIYLAEALGGADTLTDGEIKQLLNRGAAAR